MDFSLAALSSSSPNESYSGSGFTGNASGTGVSPRKFATDTKSVLGEGEEGGDSDNSDDSDGGDSFTVCKELLNRIEGNDRSVFIEIAEEMPLTFSTR